MKVWYEYGSEHSANLVMIGHFSDATAAAKAKEIMDEMTKQVSAEQDKGTIVAGSPSERYSNDAVDLLSRLNIMTIGPRELEQFLYEFSVEVEGRKVILTTEEIEISAFLKVMFNQGARIEVYSAHTHPNTKYGRGR